MFLIQSFFLIVDQNILKWAIQDFLISCHDTKASYPRLKMGKTRDHPIKVSQICDLYKSGNDCEKITTGYYW